MHDSNVALLTKLNELGIQLILEDNKLKIRGPREKVTPEITGEIRDNKASLITLLSMQSDSAKAFKLIHKRSSDENLPLSYLQRKVWLIDQLEGTSIHYNMPNVFNLEGELNKHALHKALSKIVERHESLRTVFKVGSDGKPIQVVRDKFEFDLPIVDYSHLPDNERAAAIHKEYSADLYKPFDLAADLLFRAKLIVFDSKKHALLLDTHHISSDGWSLDVLFKELCVLYTAFYHSKECPLPELTIQYPDYSLWMASWLEGESKDLQLKFWDKHLKSLPIVHSIPLDSPRPKMQSLNGKRFAKDIDYAKYEKIKQFCEQQHVTMFMFMQAVFAALLSHLSGESDVVMATPIANRERPELAPLIGFFANTVVLRTQCCDDDSFLAFLSYSKQVLLESYENQHIPFDMLVDYLNPIRSLAHNALAQITFALESKKEIAKTEINLPSLTIKPSGNNEIPTTVPSKFDLEFVVWESSKGFTFQWTYNKDLFDDETINRINDRYELFLDNVLRAPESTIHELLKPSITDIECITVWNQTQHYFSMTNNLLEMLELQCLKTPDLPAVIFKGESTTFNQLHERSNQLAHFLMTECQIKPGQLVGLCYERSLDMLVALLAILKSGAGYIPLDPGLPKNRLSFILEDSAPQLVMAHESTKNLLSCTCVPLVICAEIQTSTYPTVPPIVKLRPDSVVYAMYTSGSTGKPKGALNSHQGICNKLRTIQQQFPLSDVDRVLQKTPISFDVSVVEIFWPLTSGASIVLAEPEMHKDPLSLADLIEKYEVTTTHFVPSMLHTFLRVIDPTRLRSLKLLMIGGEALNYDLLVQAKQALPRTQMVNQYGPTEAAVDVSWWLCELREDRKVPIGKPSANVRLYILDQHKNVLPTGVAGELYIAGVQVGNGYINQQQLTSERFFEKEILGRVERMYRTGDRARWLKDGNIEFLGRLDEQVQLRGVRIELGEIESVLAGFEAIESAAVMIRDDERRGDKDLVAYIVLSPPQKSLFTESRLKEYLKQHLPEYMRPQIFVYLESIPLTPSGKLDKRSLPLPNDDHKVFKIMSPDGDTEQRLERIFAELLKVPQVCVNANFFEQGGNSLLATELRIHIQKVFSQDLPLRTIFEYPVVRELAKCLNQHGDDTLITKIPVVSEDEWQLSFAQQRFWFAAQFGGKSTANISKRLEIHGPLDIDSLRQAFIVIVERHSILRQTFPTVDSKPTLRILPKYDPLAVDDLQSLSSSEKQKQAKSLTKIHASYRFDIESEALFRVNLLKLEAEKFLLILTVHHIISDGQSLSRIIEELSVLYMGYTRNEPATIAPLPLQYGDYAIWQRNRCEGKVFQQQMDYWLVNLAGMPQLHGLPTDFSRPPRTSYAGSTFKLPLAGKLQNQLRAYSHKHDCTLFMTMLAAYKLLLSQYSGVQDICVGTPIDNRGHHQLKELSGLFVNTIVLRSKVESRNTFNELVQSVRETALGAYGNQDYPFEQLVEAINPDRSLSYNPLFQITFQLDTELQSSMQIDDLELRFAPESDGISRFDLSLFVDDGLSGLNCYWTYSTDLFLETTIERMHRHFESLLESAMEHHDSKPVSQLLVADLCDQKLLESWLQTDVPFPQQDTIVSMFDRQAAAAPTRTAIIYAGEEISYVELQHKANRLANALIEERKVATSQLIGVCMERSIELVVSLLAILKTGAGYIAFDPELPSQRLKYILQDSGVDTVLVDGKSVHPLLVNEFRTFDINSKNVSRYNHDLPVNFASTHNLAYVIYTSGSTGKPKGAMNRHSGICNKLHALQHRFNLTDEDRILQKTPINFDASVGEIFWPLTAGATLVIGEHQNIKDPRYIASLVKLYQITVLDFVPSMLKLFLQVADTSELSSLRIITIGGEALSYELQAQMIKAFPDVEKVNRYGPSEAAIEVSYWSLDSLRHDKKVPIGKPTANVRLYVLDEEQNVMPIGVAGELCISGIQVGPGYLGQQKLTEQRYIQCQVLDKIETLYRTGDKARWMADGELEFLGRLDDQVKLRGFRIELGEIENCLLAMPEINNVAVILREGIQEGSETLVAYCVPEKDVDYISVVKDRLKESLPEYMIPSHFVTLLSLPILPSGKLDRKALPAPEIGLSQDIYVAPETETEKSIVDIWSQILGIAADKISTKASFFELGGHSLLIVRLLSALQNRFQKPIQLSMFYRATTIQAQADEIEIIPSNTEIALLQSVNNNVSYPKGVFFIPGAASAESDFNEIVEHLKKAKLQIGVFRHKGLLINENFFTTIEENVNAFADCIIKSSCREIVLVGHSYGGVLALELANYLIEQGYKIQLVMLDTYFEQQKMLNDDGKSFAIDLEAIDVSNDFKNLYKHQSYLFGKYKPFINKSLQITMILAEQGPFDKDMYIDHISNKLGGQKFTYELTHGNHFSMLKDKSAKLISDHIKLLFSLDNESNETC